MLKNKLVVKDTGATTSADTALAKQYQRKTDKQHILDNPDTYIGSVENVDAQLWVFDEESKKIILKEIEYIPGLYKLFDEGIVNCRDHVIRMIQSTNENKKVVTFIDTIIAEDGTITMSNDGNGIDVAKHPEYDLWIPEMIFGHLRTSTNYNKDEKKIVGGKNGFGFKLVLIWSEYGRVETVDHIRGLKYVQEFRRNLDEICPPTITKVSTSTKPYTKVTFKPDYRRLGVQGLTPDMLSLLKKRIYDIGAVTDHSVKKIKVGLNNETIPVKNFQQYIDLYIGTKDETKRVYEQSDERWEYAVAMSPTHEFIQVSFVNGISTFKGGKHVDYIMGQIVRKLCDYIEKKKKIKVNGSAIREQLILFLRCDVENPSFDSQTKDFMNTPSAKFGSNCSVSDAFIEKVAKMGVMELACSLTEAKESKLAKKTDGTKTKTVRGIANFIDANFSGTQQSKDCILILCEGLSALSGIVSGISSSDRNTIGIYPLKGKLLNVRGEAIKKITENKEISDLKKILGLESGKVYASMEDVHKNLRYGKIMLLVDADLDGSHIKGLCINLFHSEWSSLIKIPGFLSFMNTPILRAKKGVQTLLFYNDGEYLTWKENNNTNGWIIKYFKGLGTSTAAEFKEYFANKKIVDFVYSGATSDDTIDKVFNKKRPDDRKTWLENYDKTAYLDTNNKIVQYEQFIDREMIHFSTYDCARSIPNMVDGLKISLRKILFCAFKRRLTTEIKVAQFSGYVSEHSSYHHGEQSLNGSIVNMAQNFVGSNNINLLEPNGQMGTRMHGGHDSASERYIFTLLNPLTRFLFPEADDAVLTYLNDDGTSVEPEFYTPIIPFALVNGISGIGTGFSCNIEPYNPKQLIQYLKNKLTNIPTTDIDFIPYYEGFKGRVSRLSENKYLVQGCYEKINDDTIRITELPVGTWTMPYTTFLESLMDGTAVDKAGKKIPPTIKDFTSVSTEVIVNFTVVFPKGKLQELEASVDQNGCNGIMKTLKLYSTVSATNMHMFNRECKLHKYGSVEEIIDDFYGVRMDLYQKRKNYLLGAMEQRLVKLSNRARYIQETLKGTIDLRRKTAQQVNDLLSGMEFALIDGDFKYLIKMPMDSVTEENVANIMKEKADTERELACLRATTLETMWLNELNALESEYDNYKKKREVIQSGNATVKNTIKKISKPKVT
uniref:DNA topoisomerase (ATP-hydrolyzing) n=1 Tax=viral metagenome TaxID=1070528 RepID=A0A6C0HUP4_9ZZZZ